MKYFLFEPEYQRNPTFFNTSGEWQKSIDDFCFHDRYCDDGWSNELYGVMAGIVPDNWEFKEEEFDSIEDALEKYKTHGAKMIDKQDRPSDIDSDGYTKDGEYWGEYKYKCNYVLEPVEAKL